MNLHSVTLIVSLSAVGVLQVGCASSPRTGTFDPQVETFQVGDRPQMVFPGASRAEVKALAMGSARSRAWVIAETTDDRVVARRPLDPGSPLARELGQAAATAAPGSLVEVTSYFLDDRGSVKVALDAALVSKLPDGQPTRTDVTEAFRPSLDESLRSLHSTWSRDRARVARAAPPSGPARAGETRDSGNADGAALADSGTSPPAAWSDETTPTAPTAPLMSSQTPAAATPAPSLSERASPPAPTPVAATPARPTPEPRRPSSGPAPIVDTRPVLTRTQPGSATQPMSLPEPLPQPAAETIPNSENMMALSPLPGSVSWAYYAEQYARLRGCNVEPSGSILIDSRSDGEIHKVPCAGADSVLVQCQNGDCRGLL
ncbi:hypothetical protein [Thiocapsa rosea]|uniref:Uncharacterized protein n=1 Tax=Thiocapsa rosea TaxID=69360 RepID=A0A495VF97_9GAMM|nr:hypothetical protein [Thiocapsa rosea]RKT47510.1 hypothetical protein BDD21_5106 [Thiocapsa rosea]